MDLYDKLIKSTCEALRTADAATYAPDGEQWLSSTRNEVLFQNDTAYELGSAGKKSVAFAAVTSTEGLIENPDGVTVIGRDLQALSGDASFAQIALIGVEDFSGDALECYNAIKDIEFVIYDCFPKDFMTRISAFDKRIGARVGKKALANGITFEKLGNLYAAKYKECKNVKTVKMIFITGESELYDTLSATAKTVDDITRTLNHVLTDMNFDCKNCNLKSICDQVEGLRELHFKKS